MMGKTMPRNPVHSYVLLIIICLATASRTRATDGGSKIQDARTKRQTIYGYGGPVPVAPIHVAPVPPPMAIAPMPPPMAIAAVPPQIAIAPVPPPPPPVPVAPFAALPPPPPPPPPPPAVSLMAPSFPVAQSACPGGESLGKPCDAKRPWPQCPPQSYCYAVNSVDIGPYYCCPVWSTYGAQWRPAAPFFPYYPPMPYNWPYIIQATANWGAQTSPAAGWVGQLGPPPPVPVGPVGGAIIGPAVPEGPFPMPAPVPVPFDKDKRKKDNTISQRNQNADSSS